MKALIARLLVVAITLGFAAGAYAVPVLQIGAPGGPGEGIYADYQANLLNPTEEDTAITTGFTLFVAGVYGPNVAKLGGQFDGGENWSYFGLPLDPFDTSGAILLASVPEGMGASAYASLTIGGSSAFYASATESYFPNKHDPVKDNIADFLFFNIDNFANYSGVVPDFASETGSANGEIKALTIGGTGDLPWIHFDVMALETTPKNKKIQTALVNNPGSHDVTWKSVPEPATLLLLGSGFLGLALLSRKRARTRA